jgi:hypothetical protein
MAVTKKTLSSVGGFAVDEVTVVNELRDIKNVNTFELQNSNFVDVKKRNWILKGTNTAILDLDGVGGLIPLENNTINFITAHAIGVNDTGGGHYSVKIESVATCNSVGSISILSSLDTIIKDSIPTEQTWSITPYSGSANQFSYSAVRSGTTVAVKWITHIEVVQVTWS